jgi:hypothetical protein
MDFPERPNVKAPRGFNIPLGPFGFYVFQPQNISTRHKGGAQ